MSFLQIHWDPDPVLFQIGSFAVRWYSLLFILGFFIGYMVARYMFRKENVPRLTLESYGIWLVIGVLIGGRLGHCLFYEFDYFIHHPLEIIKFWSGTLGKNAVITGFRGFSSHGWVIGLLFTLWLNSRLKKVPVLWALDIFAVVIVLAGSFVRLGNLMNSEIIGQATNLPWGFVFEKVDNVPRHPTQIYESLSLLLTFIFVFLYYRRKLHTVINGTYLGWVFIGVFVSRFLIEFIKIDQVASEATMILNLGQWLSIPFIVLGLFFAFRGRLAGLILTGQKIEKDIE